MSVLDEMALLGPTAYGAPCGRAFLKQTAEDFQVNEVLDIPLSGSGEHLWLWIEKRELNTEDAARRLAKAAGVPLRAVSYAGLKDRQALTRQWVSLHLPGQQDPDLSAAESDSLRILERTRHSRKLQRGAHSANGFILRLTALEADKTALEQRLQQIAAEGVPNYYGLQRFGFDGNNVHEARHWAAEGTLPEQRNRRSRVLSAARSYLFNQVLAARVTAGDWAQARAGDVLSFTDSRSFFPAGEQECQDPRLQALDLHPTGPLAGAGELPSHGATLALEQTLLQTHAALVAWLAAADLRQERRTLRLPVADLAWHYPDPSTLQLAFTLPSGCFATAVVRELVQLLPLNTTQWPCEY